MHKWKKSYKWTFSPLFSFFNVAKIDFGRYLEVSLWFYPAFFCDFFCNKDFPVKTVFLKQLSYFLITITCWVFFEFICVTYNVWCKIHECCKITETLNMRMQINFMLISAEVGNCLDNFMIIKISNKMQHHKNKK